MPHGGPYNLDFEEESKTHRQLHLSHKIFIFFLPFLFHFPVAIASLIEYNLSFDKRFLISVFLNTFFSCFLRNVNNTLLLSIYQPFIIANKTVKSLQTWICCPFLKKIVFVLMFFFRDNSIYNLKYILHKVT